MGDVVVPGPLKGFVAPTTKLLGDPNLTGPIGKIVLGEVGPDVTLDVVGTPGGLVLDLEQVGAGVVFRVIGGVKLFRVATGPVSCQLDASRGIRRIDCRNSEFTGVARSAESIGAVYVASLNGGIISAGTNVDRVRVAEDMVDSYVSAGYDVGSDGRFGEDDAAGHGDVRGVRVGGTFVRSYICAGMMPEGPLLSEQDITELGLTYEGGSVGDVRLGGVDFDNEVDFYFGLFAVDRVKPPRIGSGRLMSSHEMFRVD